MFGWLFGKKNTIPGFYKPKERLIFSYWDGEKDVLVDPLELYREIIAIGEELRIDIAVSRSKSKDAPEAHSKFIEKLRTLLNVKHLKDGGLTESELAQVFYTFMQYTEDIKKKFSPSLTTSKHSEDSPVISPTNPPTNSTSVSGSTVAGQCTEEPHPSQLELE
jgi:hypothetical protein